mmetsp:Transcript_101450/g.316318  ORF Transcript_101450/g.316318 Transcript_101450/m.316318 type:complete len:258 (+) Transcript_101450:531-1304(+)
MSTVKEPPARRRTEASAARTSEMPQSSQPSCSAPAAARSSGGSHRSWRSRGSPRRKRTTSASAESDVTVPLPTEPPFTTWSTFKKSEPERCSTTSESICDVLALRARLQILLCRSQYSWSPAGAAAGVHWGSAGDCSPTAAGKEETEESGLSATMFRPPSAKSCRSLARNSRGFMPTTLDRLLPNFSVNLTHKSLMSIEPPPPDLKMASSSAAAEKGFSAALWRSSATELLSVLNVAACFLTNSCSVVPSWPRSRSA